MANQKDKNGVNVGIAWCDSTVNLWWGCTKVHLGCDNCYAESLSKRFGENLWGDENPRRLVKSAFTDLNALQKQGEKKNEKIVVFIGSMMDIFEKPKKMVDIIGKVHENTTDFPRQVLFEEINLKKYENLIFLFLTKRPSNINKYIPESWKTNPPSNVMFGTSIVDQKTADTLVPQLLQVKGHKFLSVEPQLNHIQLQENWVIGSPYQKGQIDWVIQGGESGHGRRPFNLKWARDMRDYLAQFKTPYFFKQIDKIATIPDDLKIQNFPEFFNKN